VGCVCVMRVRPWSTCSKFFIGTEKEKYRDTHTPFGTPASLIGRTDGCHGSNGCLATVVASGRVCRSALRKAVIQTVAAYIDLI